MNFKKLEILDLENIDKALKESIYYNDYISSEYTPLFLLTWGKNYEIAYDESDIIVRGFWNKRFYLPPISNDLKKAYDKIIKNDNDFFFYGITDELNLIDAINDRNCDEYIYDSSLLTLKGKKLHNKRNLLNQFQKNDYIFREYNESDYNNIINFFNEWNIEKDASYELEMIKEALKYVNKYCFCDVIYINNSLKAFSIGCVYNNIGYTFFEKADNTIKGCYQAINYLFSNKHYKDCKLINRQEDLGILELRNAKLSYNPIKLLKKYKKSYL